MKYRVNFERIGRNHSPEPMLIAAIDADDLADKIFTHIRKGKLLASREFEVTVDLELMKGSLDFGRFGNFTIEEVKE